jgi:hypothetical protein
MKIPITGGNFQAPNGVPLAGGTVTFRLSNDAVAGDDQLAAGRLVSFPLDANGNLSGQIWPNDSMLPPNTTYKARAYTAQGQLVWESEFYVTTPSWVEEETTNE